jgi:cytidine deaminase
MWNTVPTAIKELNVSLRTLRRKISAGELITKKEFEGKKGSHRLYIWISKTGELPPNAMSVPLKMKSDVIVIGRCISDKKEIVPEKEPLPLIPSENIMDEETGEAIAQDLQQAFQNEQLTETNQLNIKTADTDEIDNPEWKNSRKEDRERAIAKFEITKRFMCYRNEMKAKGICLAKSGPNFVKRLKKGDFCRNALCILKINKIELPTLKKWERILKASDDIDSPVSLLEAYRHCGRPCNLEPFIIKMIRDYCSDPRNHSAEWIYNQLLERLELEDIELNTSKRSIQLMVAEFKNDINTKARGQGKSAMRNKVKLHNVRINDLLPGELWESDGHKCNVLVKSPFYTYHKVSKRYLVRPVVIFWWDVATGQIVGYRVCLNENKGATRNALMDAILIYGLPKGIRVDNAGSYKNVEYSPMEYYKNIKNKKRLSNYEKIAKRMIESGDMGLYRNIGLDYHFTIPGNPESKSIEAAWKIVFGDFERWLDTQIKVCNEDFQGIENRVLLRKYRDEFFSWESFCDLLDKFVIHYNNKPKPSNQTVDGIKLSPLQTYNQVEHEVPSYPFLLAKMRDPYIEMRVVYQSFIEKNGIYYWHPVFASKVGEKIGIYYDEKTLQEIIICNEAGQIYPEKAVAINPGVQSGDNLTQLIENTRRNKIGKLFYLAHCDLTGAEKAEKMLKLIGNELLPLSKSKKIFDYAIDLGSSDALPQWAEGIDKKKKKIDTPEDSARIQKMLFEKAKEVSVNSYSPNSGLQVGVALLCSNNKIYTACNVESTHSKENVCAERVAILKAVSSNVREFLAIGIYMETIKLQPPCSACRKALSEFCDDMLVIYGNDEKQIVSYLKEIE